MSRLQFLGHWVNGPLCISSSKCSSLWCLTFYCINYVTPNVWHIPCILHSGKVFLVYLRVFLKCQILKVNLLWPSEVQVPLSLLNVACVWSINLLWQSSQCLQSFWCFLFDWCFFCAFQPHAPSPFAHLCRWSQWSLCPGSLLQPRWSPHRHRLWWQVSPSSSPGAAAECLNFKWFSLICSYVRFWNIFSSECPEQVASMQNGLCCSYSPDGSVLAVGLVSSPHPPPSWDCTFGPLVPWVVNWPLSPSGPAMVQSACGCPPCKYPACSTCAAWPFDVCCPPPRWTSWTYPCAWRSSSTTSALSAHELLRPLHRIA